MYFSIPIYFSHLHKNWEEIFIDKFWYLDNYQNYSVFLSLKEPMNSDEKIKIILNPKSIEEKQ